MIKYFFALLFVIFFQSCADQTPPDFVQSQKVSAVSYYSHYNGHTVDDLEQVRKGLIKSGCKAFVYYLGDSSLDNKHWLFAGKSKNDVKNYSDNSIAADAINGYQSILEPPRMIKDIDYWMNKLLSEKNGEKVCSIMTSVEATTLRERETTLRAQDLFVQKYISKNDYLIVSVGGNDIAMSPSAETQKHIRDLNKDPTDQNALNGLLAIFKDKTKKYIEEVIKSHAPKKIIISMIYYPDEKGPSWAGSTLTAFGYYTYPKKLQNLIDKMFGEGTRTIKIKESTVIPLKLSSVLNGKTSSDYVSGVEPSMSGGKKMAQKFFELLFTY